MQQTPDTPTHNTPTLYLSQRRLATRHHSRDIPKVSAHVTIDTEKL